MAGLTTPDQVRGRQFLARGGVVRWTKAQIGAALQAIEDAMTTDVMPPGAVGQTVPQLFSTVIDTATTPLVLTAEEKKRLFAVWAELKFQRDK